MTHVAIIPAAGASQRLGHPKQLVKYQEQSLVRLAVSKALDAGFEKVVVVLGAHENEIAAELGTTKCIQVHHTLWKEGLGSSIAAGATFALSEFESVESVLLFLCDQPLVRMTHLRSLHHASSTGKIIAATSYPEGSAGIPACFPPRYLPTLASLSGASGAKSLIASEQSVLLNCPEANFDIDVPADLEKLS